MLRCGPSTETFAAPCKIWHGSNLQFAGRSNTRRKSTCSLASQKQSLLHIFWMIILGCEVKLDEIMAEQDCICGCGEKTKGDKFCPRHDQKLRKAIEVLCSTTDACLAPLETSRQQRPKKTLMHSATCSIWSCEMKLWVFGETGASQFPHQS